MADHRAHPSRPRYATEEDAVDLPDPESEAPRAGPEVPPAPEPEAAPEAPAVPMAPPSAHALPETATLALIQAFTAMCVALRETLSDNEVLAGHCDEIQGWMANSGGDVHSPNAVMAFRHMVKVLEEALGHSMALP